MDYALRSIGASARGGPKPFHQTHFSLFNLLLPNSSFAHFCDLLLIQKVSLLIMFAFIKEFSVEGGITKVYNVVLLRRVC